MRPRLLNQLEIDRKKSQEKLQEMSEGMKLAEHIDTLRETKANEEAAFQDYRNKTLKGIQEEIQVLSNERDGLRQDIARKKEEWRKLLEPLDQQWAAYVKGEKERIDSQVKENEAKALELTTKAMQLTEREAETKTLARKLEQERHEYQSLVAGAKQKDAEALHTLQKARDKAQTIVSNSEAVLAQADRAKQTLEDLKTSLKLKEMQLEKEKKELQAREFKVLAKELQFYSPVKKQ